MDTEGDSRFSFVKVTLKAFFQIELNKMLKQNIPAKTPQAEQPEMLLERQELREITYDAGS